MVLTGGGDIDPNQYGNPGVSDYCSDIDAKRDSLDLLMINTSFERDVPLLGVCRGMQMMNVAGGGTLIADLPAMKESYIHQQRIGDMEHDVYVVSGSQLHSISGCLATIVNSNHHQAIDELAQGYEIMALAPDSIIESMWWSDTTSHSYALGVMWHPERLEKNNKLAGNIAQSFIDAIQQD
jgi:putative glutamine amidotransferase